MKLAAWALILAALTVSAKNPKGLESDLIKDAQTLVDASIFVDPTKSDVVVLSENFCAQSRICRVHHGLLSNESQKQTFEPGRSIIFQEGIRGGGECEPGETCSVVTIGHVRAEVESETSQNIEVVVDVEGSPTQISTQQLAAYLYSRPLRGQRVKFTLNNLRFGSTKKGMRLFLNGKVEIE